MPRLGALTPLIAAGIIVASGFAYVYQLDRSPVYLSLDEAHFAVHAHALATTAANLNGDVLPLFINLADPQGDQPVLPWGNTWYQPFLFYLIALFLQVLPLGESSIRLPTAILGGVINVALIFAVARRLLPDRRWALAAAAMLALCPANVIISRQALDYSCPLFFVLAWLWCLAEFARAPRLRFASGIGLILGAGCYSYITSWMMMPLYLALSWCVFIWVARSPFRPIVASAVAFAVPLLALVPWFWLHPEMLGNLWAAYNIPDPEYVSVFQAWREGQGASGALRRAIAVYWTYFDPSYLFISGGASRKVSTGEVGVLLLSMAVLLPVGLYALTRKAGRTWITLVLVAGFLSAPLPATLKGAPFAVERTMAILPFAVLISAYGLWFLWESRRRGLQALAVLLLLWQPLQFAGFYRDYLSQYRLRSAFAYDSTAFAEAAPFLVESARQGDVPAVYLTAPMSDVSAKWRFWTAKLGHQDLLAKTRYFNGDMSALAGIAPGTLAVIPADEAVVGASVASGRWQLIRTSRNVTGEATVSILRKSDERPSP